MTIDTGISSSIRKPGRYQKFNVANAARGGQPSDRAIALIGIKSASGTFTAEQPTEVFDEAGADQGCGSSSELALMARWAMLGARDYGKRPRIFVVPIDAPSGAARVQTIAIGAGTATESEELIVKIAGRIIRAAIVVGDDQDAAAIKLRDSSNEQSPNLPFTAALDGTNANEVDYTAAHAGVNAADAEFEILQTVAGLGTISTSEETAGAGTADITNALDSLLDRDYDFVVAANHQSADIADFAAHHTSAWNAGTKRWRHSVLAERGSLATAQALATAADDYKQIVISAEGFRNTCGEIAAYVAGALGGEDDVKLPWNDVELLSLYLPEPADVPSDAEIETGIAGGLFMLGVNDNGTRAKVIRACTTMVSFNSVPYYELLDLSVSALLVKTARRLDTALALAFPRATIDPATQRRMYSVAFATLKQMENEGDLKDVDLYANELVVEVDANVSTRYNVAAPSSPVRPLNQIANVINLLV
jgi:phage tail sheath gpL-like